MWCVGTGRVWRAVCGRCDEDTEGGLEREGAPEGPNTGVCVVSQCRLGLERVVVKPAEGVKWWGEASGVTVLGGAVDGGLDWRGWPGWGPGSLQRLRPGRGERVCAVGDAA